MKLHYYIILVFIIVPSQSFAKLENVNTNYELKLNIFGIYVKIGDINSYLTSNNKKYNLNFDLVSDDLVNIISPIIGNGIINGSIDGSFLYPENYRYTYTKKNKKKFTKIQFYNSNVTSSETIPEYDKNKLTPIDPKMLLGTIDPITAIIYIGNYNLNNKCSINYRIYDGKRRYDLNYTAIFDKDGYVVCRLTQKKIGGFKLINEKKDLFKPAQQIDTYYQIIDDKYVLKKIITKSKFSKILINVSYF